MTVIYENDLPEGVDFGDSVAIDCEMMGLNPNRDILCLMQFADKEGNCYLVQFDGKNYSAPNIKKLLKDKNVQKIGQYIRKDMAFMKKYLGVMPNNVYCTKIASKLCRTYSDGHSLRHLVPEIIGVELEKETTHTDWSESYLTKKQLKYAINDVIYLHQIRDALDKKIKKVNREKLLKSCLEFLATRVELDLLGFEDDNILNHH